MCLLCEEICSHSDGFLKHLHASAIQPFSIWALHVLVTGLGAALSPEQPACP